MKPGKFGTLLPPPVKSLADSAAKTGPGLWKITTGAIHHFLTKLDQQEQHDAIKEALAWSERQCRREAEGETAAGRAKEEGRDAIREENHEDKRRRKSGGSR